MPLILLRLISWQYVRKHRLRSLLTTMGIVLGVAIFVGMHAAGASVLSALSSTIDHIAGKTQLQVTSGEAGFPEDVLDRVQSVHEVAVAAPVIEAVVRSGIKREGNLLILGVDMTGDRSLREYDLEAGDREVVDDPLVFLAQPDSLIVTRDFAQRNRLAVGSEITMQTMEGERKFTVRGIMRPGGLSVAFGGNLAIMDIYAAQKVFGRGRRFDRLDVRLIDDSSLNQGRLALQQALGPGFQVDVPAARSRQFDSLLHVYSFMVNLTSLFALFIGLFIIHNAFAIAVTQRRAEIGILRALGASRRQVLVLFLTESAIAGLIGSATGIVLGSLIAKVMAGFIGNIMQAQYGIAERANTVSFRAGLIMAALAMGVATSIVAALLPARDAARIDPTRALQRGRNQPLSAGGSCARRIAAGVLVVLALGCVGLGHSRVVFYTGYLCFVSAALHLTPTFSLWLSRWLRPLLTALWPVEGTLAADSLTQTPRRTSATVAALMLSVGLVVSLGGISRSTYESVVDWVDNFLNADLLVLASEDGTNRNFHFPDSLTPLLASFDGVTDVQRMRSNKVPVKGSSVLMVAMDMNKAVARSSGRIVAGDFNQMYRLAAKGKGAIISENCGLLQNIGMGDVVEIPSPSGLLRLPVVGIVTDYLNQSGTVFVDYEAVYLPFWKDPTVDMYKVFLQQGTPAENVKQRIQASFSKQRRMFVMLNAEVKARVMSNTRQWLGLSYIQIAVAIIVAVLGIANTLLVSVTDRRREFASLRAVGAFRNQVRRSVWLEAISIGAIGVMLGVAFGAIVLLYDLHVVRRDYAGLTLHYAFPLRLVLLLGASMVFAAWFSALTASEMAARNSIVEALEYE
jgi:putative ABC transport system permease protein